METEDSIYRQLQKCLDRLPAGFPEVESGLDIRLLKHLFTPEEAKLATQLSMKPEPLRRIHGRVKKSGMSFEELQKLVDQMAHKGTILVSEEGYSEKHYSNAAFSVGGIYNYQVDRLTRDLIDEYWQYQSEARSRSKAVAKIPKRTRARKMLPLRTIPIEKSIALPERMQVSHYDDVRRLIEDVQGKIAVANCICRQSGDLQGKPCTKTNLRETCLIIGPDHAKRHVDMGIGRFITKEEAFSILDKVQEAGLVLQPENSKQPEAICCCCGDCCVLLKQVTKDPRPANLYISNYYVTVNPEFCNGCGDCVQICQLNARVVADGISTVNLDRCIGCGNCVTVCATHANRLQRKEGEMFLFNDKEDYHMTMLSNRVGKRKILLLKTKMLLGLKV
jgi:Fe-S-cluster-containing hydrogenase component 2